MKASVIPVDSDCVANFPLPKQDGYISGLVKIIVTRKRVRPAHVLRRFYNGIGATPKTNAPGT